jgi:hypothetical protein
MNITKLNRINYIDLNNMLNLAYCYGSATINLTICEIFS